MGVSNESSKSKFRLFFEEWMSRDDVDWKTKGKYFIETGLCSLIQSNDEVYIDLNKCHAYWNNALNFIESNKLIMTADQEQTHLLVGMFIS